jgi:biotin carboxyl carrier protein
MGSVGVVAVASGRRDDRPVRTRSTRRALIVSLLVGTLAFATCTAASADDQSSIAAAPTAASPDVSEPDTISPLIIAALAPDPTPFKGSDDRFHVAYELTVLNFAPGPATITELETIAPDGTVVTSLTQQEVAERTMIVADYSGARSAAGSDGPRLAIPSGKTALLILEDVYTRSDAIPTSVTHRIAAEFGPPESGEGAIAVLWPEKVNQKGGRVTTGTGKPVRIGAPLTGPGWLMENSCCTLNAHRNVILPVDGRINGAERLAIDASKIDVAASTRGAPPEEVFLDGDPTKNESNRSYGAPVLAVADGTVVQVIADVPDTAPGTLPLGPGFTLANLGGNAVILELAADLYAVYYHLAPRSPTVKVGDKVTKGQQIAELGNSGNSSDAHLHFQLSRTPLIFSADTVAYVFDRFTVVGSLDPATGRLVPDPSPGPRRRAFPIVSNVIDFPPR